MFFILINVQWQIWSADHQFKIRLNMSIKKIRPIDFVEDKTEIVSTTCIPSGLAGTNVNDPN